MRHFIFSTLLLACTFTSCQFKEAQIEAEAPAPEAFVRVSGQDLILPDGNKLFIKGTNLGNWLNPEGYMFGFSKTNSGRFIDEMFSQMVGPDFTAEFWREFKDNYITRKDVEFIASTGANTIRLPFHYKLFTDEDYMGLKSNQDGFARVDSVVSWCRDNGLYLILDMHDAPGGQTGDNIDDSYGYPWLFDSDESQQLFCYIWRKIADYYKNETVILGYELINEPIAPYFANMEELNNKLELVHKRAVKAIREVDNNHIILLGGAQWNGNFKPFKDSKYDDKLMYTCHRYGGAPTKEAIQEIINFRDSVNLPMYMGEIGHNTDEWQAAFCKVMEENNIGYTFWPYKKKDSSCFMGIKMPENWEQVVAFSEAPRGTYKEIRDARPDQGVIRKAMMDFIESSKCENNLPQVNYIRSLGLNVDESFNNK
ncbi:glycoside hydrolase family 5 protein [uncultured Bacteroides sp.]|uniref:glycoside hydrolase family 5 protein n=1 Tax=uncultured Bacteroides sp. TaxID=162156 RepID=UPI0025DC01C5|nr:glycoside hydrolase family 5 protein [uncultured Bacteroides sp.]